MLKSEYVSRLWVQKYSQPMIQPTSPKKKHQLPSHNLSNNGQGGIRAFSKCYLRENGVSITPQVKGGYLFIPYLFQSFRHFYFFLRPRQSLLDLIINCRFLSVF